jgi:hypothetical protein
MIIKCEKCYNEMPLIHYPDVGYFIEPCKYCQEEGLNEQSINDLLDESYNDGYYDALSEIKESLNNVHSDISSLDMDIESLLFDIDKKEKEKKNE